MSKACSYKENVGEINIDSTVDENRSNSGYQSDENNSIDSESGKRVVKSVSYKMLNVIKGCKSNDSSNSKTESSEGVCDSKSNTLDDVTKSPEKHKSVASVVLTKDNEVGDTDESISVISNALLKKVASPDKGTSLAEDSDKLKYARKKKSTNLSEENESTENATKNNEYNVSQYSVNNSDNILNRTIKVEPDDNEITIVSGGECDTMDNFIEAPPEKKKRGRPRKSAGPSGINVSNKDKAKAANEENKSVSSVSSSGDKVVVKRGRGRPRKSDAGQLCNVYITEKRDNDYTPDSLFHKGPSSSRGSDGNAVSRRRKINKPRRFGSFESFEFMDTNDKNAFSPDNMSGDDHEEDVTIADSLHLTHLEDEDDEDEEDEERTCKKHNGGGDAKPKRGGKRKRVVKLALGRDEENEFDAFGKNVALQLKEVSLQDALELQIQILSLISNRRLHLCRENVIEPN